MPSRRESAGQQREMRNGFGEDRGDRRSRVGVGLRSVSATIAYHVGSGRAREVAGRSVGGVPMVSNDGERDAMWVSHQGTRAVPKEREFEENFFSK